MTPASGASRRAAAPAPMAAVVWLLAALFAAVPGWLVLTNAENRLVEAGGLALVIAAVVAVVTGAACVRGVATILRWSSALVVLLCLVAPVTLAVDGDTGVRGALIFGGAAALLAVVAGALTLRAAQR